MSSQEQVTIVEIAEALSIHRTSAVRRAKKEGWESVRESSTSGRAKSYPIATLPEQVRQALAKRTPIDTLLPATLPTTGQAIPLKPRAIKPMNAKQRMISAAKYELVRLYLSHLETAEHGNKVEARDEFMILYKAKVWPALASILGQISWKTLEKWKLLIQEHGDPAILADARGAYSRGATGLSDQQKQILATFAMSPNKMRISHCIQWAKVVMRKHDIDTMSTATYRRYLTGLQERDYASWVFYREGEQALENKCGYTISRDWDKIGVGDLVTADGHVLNFQVLNPWTGKPCRPTLLLWYDCRSNMPLGWEIMPTENTEAIHTALRRAIIALGKIPLVAYLDNGRAFKSKHFTGVDTFDNGQISSLYARLGMATTFATPYHGQSKTVERFFGTLLAVESLMPTYIGNSIDNKPARMHRGERLHRQLWERCGNGSTAISLTQCHEILALWFDEYANTPQRGHLKGQTPLEVFTAGKGPGVDQALLAELMMSQTVRTITKEGIRMLGQCYYHPALYGRRQPVLVRYDLMERDSIYIYEPSGEFVCRAESKQGVHPAARLLGTEDDLTALEEELATKNRIKTTTVGPARKLLREQILPEVQGYMQQIGISPEGQPISKPAKEQPIALDYARERREAARMAEIGHLEQAAEQQQALLQMSEADRYERLVELESRGHELSEQWIGFMAYYQKTTAYLDNAEYWEQLSRTTGLQYRTATKQA